MNAPRPDDDVGSIFPGEPGVTDDARPPFVADHPTTRWLFALNRKGIRPGLRRVRGLLADLGNPEQGLPTVVVAGTNGKGSTTRLLAALYRGAGLRTACYTSPHLLRVYERLTIDDRPVDPELFRRRVEELKPAVERHEASWFETLTAAAVSLARDAEVDVFCCETGLGGRLDASNALPAQAVLLTGVSLDHQHILGETVPEILDEKLGLLKPGVPLVTALRGDLKERAFRAAVLAGAPSFFLDEITRCDVGEAAWDLVTRDRVHRGLPLLGGEVMRRNAALALLAADVLADRGELPRPPDPAAALRDAFLPGRFQPVLAGPDWICDTAHNAEALELALGMFLARPCAGRRHVLFGSMADKDPGDGAGVLLRRADTVTAAVIGLPRSRNPEQLRSLMDRWGLAGENGACVCPDLGAAIARLAAEAGPDDAVLACGSCFLVAELLWRLGVRDLEETRTVRPAADVLPRREGTS